MGSAASISMSRRRRREEENVEDDALSICRQRKRLIKLAVARRRSLANAHRNYSHSLYAVAMALRLFVARQSSPPSAFLITLPSQSPSSSSAGGGGRNPVLKAAVSSLSSSLEGEKEDDGGGEEEEREICEHFYGDSAPELPSPENVFRWDFFSPFDGDPRAATEAEGRAELEEEEEHKPLLRGGDSVTLGEQKGSGGIDTCTKGRELLEALKDVEDHFVRACESGGEVSRMLETNTAPLHYSCFQEIQYNPNKNLQSIAWHGSTSSSPSFLKNLLASGSRSSSQWESDFKRTELCDEYGGMDSGSHSLTLERLYEWEKKIYEEVKAGDDVRKLYEQKCLQLRNQLGAKRKGLQSVEKTEDEVRELYSRMLVAIRTVESISEKIQKLRDEELQPQLVELLHGIMTNWKLMLKSHETQKQAMFETTLFTCPAYGKFCNDSRRIATHQLEAELQNWRACFAEYVSAQKAYAEALHGWLSKLIAPEVGSFVWVRSSVLRPQMNGPPLFSLCHDWLTTLQKLPHESVIYAMKSFAKDIQALWAQQGEEQQQKRKVDGLAKELERRVLALQRAEEKVLESKVSRQKTEINVRKQVEFLAERKDLLDVLRKKLEVEKARHWDSMEETQQMALHGFQAGFSSVFESLTEFSKTSLKIYADLVAICGNGEAGN
ncbi:protein ALTERED PHOSPHATE STARVATION RESPONSE 1-like [Diospyros lotus]|uniref:protein ALTERED PHOSPHATE STARVATION RESPONSE 1-like n=1 Tax=Diospyros lotus TaxID=55363 RepID=UPI002259AB5E|nr:protein ALTERED PHOSPHATE STARVATION RESPONSE 1-like [Diospyros lotus]